MGLQSTIARATACSTRTGCVLRIPGLQLPVRTGNNAQRACGSFSCGGRQQRRSCKAVACLQIVAFLEKNPSSQTAPAAQTDCHQLTVHTMDGRYHTFPFIAGTTTARGIRVAVAERTNVAVDKVRLAYAGLELGPSQDSTPFSVKPGIRVLHAMQRMSGGGAATADEDSTAAVAAATAPGRRRRNPTKANTSPASSVQNAIDTLGAPHSDILIGPADGNSSELYSAPAGVFSSATSQGHSSISANSSSSITTPLSGGRHVTGTQGGLSAEVQLAKQFRALLKNPIPGISAAPDDDNLLKWHIKLAGPEGSPYEGGWFDVTMEFTKHFPGEQPSIKFMTKIWHPNVSWSSGDVCVDMYPDWHVGTAVRNVACLLLGLQMLLSSPNFNSPLNPECAKQMRTDMKAFETEAKNGTWLYAMQP